MLALDNPSVNRTIALDLIKPPSWMLNVSPRQSIEQNRMLALDFNKSQSVSTRQSTISRIATTFKTRTQQKSERQHSTIHRQQISYNIQNYSSHSNIETSTRILIAQFNPYKTSHSKDSLKDSNEIEKNIGVRTLQTQRNRKKNNTFERKRVRKMTDYSTTKQWTKSKCPQNKFIDSNNKQNLIKSIRKQK